MDITAVAAAAFMQLLPSSVALLHCFSIENENHIGIARLQKLFIYSCCIMGMVNDTVELREGTI